jgi:transposase
LQVHTADKDYALAYDRRALTSLVRSLRKQPHALVVCEATGGYERPLLSALFGAKVPFALVSPARVRAFAASEGIRAKTDPIDAKVLWRFAQEKQLQPTPAPSPASIKLAALNDRRAHLTEHIAREKNRLEKGCALLRPSIQRMLKCLERELQRIEADIRALIQADPALTEKVTRCTSVKGVGEVTAWAILAYLGEITKLSRNKLVALAGLAPFNRDSGNTQRKRRIIGGRAKLRKALYMAAHTAAIHNPVIRQYVKALRDRGKPYKSAIVAAMRKLLLHLQSILKKPEFSPCD